MAVASKAYHVRVTDITDRELLGIIDRECDEDGFTETPIIAAALWPTLMANGHEQHKIIAIRAVSTRLAWMRRYGVVTRWIPGKRDVKPKYANWTLTEDGQRLLKGRLGAGAERALGTLGGPEMVLAIHRLTENDRDEMVEVLMRRAWQFGMHRR